MEQLVFLNLNVIKMVSLIQIEIVKVFLFFSFLLSLVYFLIQLNNNNKKDVIQPV